jgi:hypothetical protein
MSKLSLAVRTAFLSSLLGIFAVLVPSALAADCWQCSPSSVEPQCEPAPRFGYDEECIFYEICVNGQCYDECGYGGGNLCGSELALNGQIVPADHSAMGLEAYLYDANMGVYRQSCNGAILAIGVLRASGPSVVRAPSRTISI